MSTKLSSGKLQVRQNQAHKVVKQCLGVSQCRGLAMVERFAAWLGRKLK